MARESCFVLDCSLYTDSIVQLIRAFHQIGWSCFGDRKAFLPLHDDDNFDWQTLPITDEELLSLIAEKQACGELCGVILCHQHSDAGVSLLARNTKEVQLNPGINRKTVCGDFTDASWYIENIAAKLEEIGCTVQSMEYSEIIG